MEELDIDDDVDDDIEVDEEAEVDVPALEARVPAEWQAKMAAKALKTAAPMPPAELLSLCASSIEGCAVAEATKPTTLPDYVWDSLSAKHGRSHKQTEQALSAIIAGIEASWAQEKTVQLFGELCGMLTADHSVVVTRRVLSLLGSGELVASDAIAATLTADDDEALVGREAVLAALPRLRLSPAAQSELEAAVGDLDAGEGSVRLDAFLVAATLGVRAHAATAPPDIVEEEEWLRATAMSLQEAAVMGGAGDEAAEAVEDGADDGGGDVDEYEDDVEDDDGDGDGTDDGDGNGDGGVAGSSEASAGARFWSSLAAKLPAGAEGAPSEARRALFAQLDADADGSLSLMELEETLPSALLAGTGGEGGRRVPLLRPLIISAFEAAKGLEGGSLVVTDASCSVDEFDAVATYLHAACSVLAHLRVTSEAAELPSLDAAAFSELGAQLPAEWGLEPAEIDAGFNQLDGWASGRVRGDDACRWLVTRAMRALCPPRWSESAEGDVLFANHTSPPPPPPPGGLDPVFESTERSAFSTTYGGAGSGVEAGGEGAVSDGTLGAQSGLGSVKVGFFDASKLELDEEELSSPLRPKYEKVLAEHEQLQIEVQQLRAALDGARAAEQKQRQLHTANVKKMLEANEALHAQLRDLNGVVERVVMKELGAAGKGGRGGREPPPSVFPMQAKPGSKGGAGPVRAKPPQLPPGAMPFK